MTIFSSRIGNYRHRIAFQEQSETQDSSGAMVKTWVNVKGLTSVPAEVIESAGNEIIADATKQGKFNSRINCRWFSGIKESWRILFDGRVYEILDYHSDSTARRQLRIKCSRGVSNG